MKFYIPSDFNTYFSDVIKERGKLLFENHKVKCIKIYNENKVEAYIEGTQMYHVCIKNKNGKLHMDCSCPCKMHCKHEYALLLHLIALDQVTYMNRNTTYKTFTKAINKHTNKLSTEDKWTIFFKVLETIVTVVLYFFLFLVAIIFSIGMNDYIPCGSRRGKKYKARRTYYKGGKKRYRYYY